MKSASQSFQPRVISLESRCQPGSMLFRGLDTSLLAGTLVPLDLQDQVQDQRTPALVAPQSQAITPSLGDVALIAPVQNLGSVNLSNPVQTIQDSHSIVLDQIKQLQTLPSLANPAPIGGGKIHQAGSGCGEAVTNGNFGTGDLTGWSVAIPGDPFVNVTVGGAYGTELTLGTVGSVNIIQQEVPTPTCFNYVISFDAISDGGNENQLTVLWNNQIVAHFVNDPGFGSTHFSMAIFTPESDSTLTIVERQDPAFWHVSNFSAFA